MACFQTPLTPVTAVAMTVVIARATVATVFLHINRRRAHIGRGGRVVHGRRAHVARARGHINRLGLHVHGLRCHVHRLRRHINRRRSRVNRRRVAHAHRHTRPTHTNRPVHIGRAGGPRRQRQRGAQQQHRRAQQGTAACAGRQNMWQSADFHDPELLQRWVTQGAGAAGQGQHTTAAPPDAGCHERFNDPAAFSSDRRCVKLVTKGFRRQPARPCPAALAHRGAA